MTLALLLFIIFILPAGVIGLGAYWIYSWRKVQEAREKTKFDIETTKEIPPTKKGVLS